MYGEQAGYIAKQERSNHAGCRNEISEGAEAPSERHSVNTLNTALNETKKNLHALLVDSYCRIRLQSIVCNNQMHQSMSAYSEAMTKNKTQYLGGNTK